jgi:hypothetical protein
MQSRTHRDVAYFDRSVGQLRTYIGLLTGTPPRRKSRKGARK